MVGDDARYYVNAKVASHRELAADVPAAIGGPGIALVVGGQPLRTCSLHPDEHPPQAGRAQEGEHIAVQRVGPQVDHEGQVQRFAPTGQPRHWRRPAVVKYRQAKLREGFFSLAARNDIEFAVLG